MSYCDWSGANCYTVDQLAAGGAETDPQFMAQSGNFYLATNPAGYVKP